MNTASPSIGSRPLVTIDDALLPPSRARASCMLFAWHAAARLVQFLTVRMVDGGPLTRLSRLLRLEEFPLRGSCFAVFMIPLRKWTREANGRSVCTPDHLSGALDNSEA